MEEGKYLANWFLDGGELTTPSRHQIYVEMTPSGFQGEALINGTTVSFIWDVDGSLISASFVSEIIINGLTYTNKILLELTENLKKDFQLIKKPISKSVKDLVRVPYGKIIVSFYIDYSNISHEPTRIYLKERLEKRSAGYKPIQKRKDIFTYYMTWENFRNVLDLHSYFKDIDIYKQRNNVL